MAASKTLEANIIIRVLKKQCFYSVPRTLPSIGVTFPQATHWKTIHNGHIEDPMDAGRAPLPPTENFSAKSA